MATGPDTTLTAEWGSQGPASESNGPILVDETELVRWLTATFQTYPGCAAVFVERIFRLDAPDTQGCNWSRTLFLSTAGASPVAYGAAYAAIVERARKTFNLLP